MPEPVSTVGICLIGGYALVNTYARGNSAVSREADAARRAVIALVERAERSEALFGDKAVALSQLQTLAAECAKENENGGDAALDPAAISNAEAFVRALPTGMPLPEFAPEPDGAISLDWIESRTRLFSLSVGPGQRLAYAWLDGSDRGHGVASFNGSTIPARVLEGIRGIMNHGHFTLGTA